MTTVVAIYTGHGLADPLKALFAEHLPDVKLYNILDDSLILQVIDAGQVTQPVRMRLMQYYKHAVDLGADYILNTCSSVGEVASAARNIFDTPILKIDEPMARQAVGMYEKIGVVATLPTTLKPTINLLKSQADQIGKRVALVEGLAGGAYQAVIAGDLRKHDELILKTAADIASQADAIVLAQGSMARMQEALQVKTGIPVLASPMLCVKEMKNMLG